MRFTVDILDSNDNILGDGPLTNLTRLEDTASLDVIGSATFEMPASDPRIALIVAGRKFDIYDSVDGYLGRFLYKSKEISDKARVGTLRVNCYDALKELSRQTVAFRRSYTYVAVDQVVADLIGLIDGWSSESDEDIGHTSVTYDGESVFVAIDALRDSWGQHFRLLSPRTLQFGAFGQASGIRLTNLAGQVQAEFAAHPEIGIIDSITMTEDADDVIFNRVVPLGAGQGTSQLTIEKATEGDYTVQSAANQDGSLYYFIEDADSVAAYGRRTKVLTATEISPITNSEANIINAANTLKLTAEAYIKKHLGPTITYEITARGLRQTVFPGDTVRLTYRGMVNGYCYIDVDEDFYVMDITRSRSANGDRSAKLTISSTATRRTADSDVLVEVVNDISVLKVHVPITLAYAPIGPYVRGLGPSHTAEFVARIGNEVTILNYAILRFKTSPLRSNVTGAAAGGASETTSSSGGGTSTTSGSGGGTSTTSGSGGGSTTTSSSSGSHSHTISIYGGSSTTSYDVYWDGVNNRFHLPSVGSGTTYAQTSSSADAHTHTLTLSTHTHTITIDAHTHTITIDAHTHTVTLEDHTHDMSYGFYDDTNYPQTISLAINGTDVTDDLGGPWADDNASVEIEVEITEYFTDASGGLRQNHSLVFSCTDGQGEIEAEVDMLVSIQAIAVS